MFTFKMSEIVPTQLLSINIIRTEANKSFAIKRLIIRVAAAVKAGAQKS